jgi:hypothetical protein
MRIFTAVRHSRDPGFFYGGLWSGNFYPALRQLGHEVVESEVDLRPASEFMQVADRFTREQLEVRARITQEILDEVRAAHRQRAVGLFLSYFYNAHFDPAAFDELHGLGIPTVNFYCNSMYQFELVAAIAARVRFAWHAEKPARPLYQKVGANPVWVQMGADPEVYRPLPGVARQARACFVGQRYADRDRLLGGLVARDVPVHVYGSGWRTAPGPAPARGPRAGSASAYLAVVLQNLRHQGLAGGLARSVRQWAYRRGSRRFHGLLAGAVQGYAADVSRTFAAYDVVLNFSNVWADGRPGSDLIPHVRLRDFEAPMCRACYLTGHTEEIAEFYDLGKEIDTYRTADELVDKARYYLSQPAAAERLREAGYRRARRDHTWARRFDQLLRAVGTG